MTQARGLDGKPVRDFFRKKKKPKSVNLLDARWMRPVSTAARMRAANRVPEAVVKLASFGGNAGSVQSQFDYISRQGALDVELNDGSTLHDIEDMKDLVEEWAESFHKSKTGKERNTVHLVVSAPRDSDHVAVLNAGREFAKEIFAENYRYGLAFHDDSEGENPHVHIIAATRGQDGSRFTIDREDFDRFRDVFAEKCRDWGLAMNATPRDVRGAERDEPSAVKRMRQRGAPTYADQPKQNPTQTEIAKRQLRLDYEAAQHRRLADAIKTCATFAEPADRAAFTEQARNLYALSLYLEAGGELARPERLRDLGVSHMADDIKTDGRDPLTEERMLQTLREANDKAGELVREALEKTPEGKERDGLAAALDQLGAAREGLDPAQRGPGDPANDAPTDDEKSRAEKLVALERERFAQNLHDARFAEHDPEERVAFILERELQAKEERHRLHAAHDRADLTDLDDQNAYDLAAAEKLIAARQSGPDIATERDEDERRNAENVVAHHQRGIEREIEEARLGPEERGALVLETMIRARGDRHYLRYEIENGGSDAALSPQDHAAIELARAEEITRSNPERAAMEERHAALNDANPDKQSALRNDSFSRAETDGLFAIEYMAYREENFEGGAKELAKHLIKAGWNRDVVEQMQEHARDHTHAREELTPPLALVDAAASEGDKARDRIAREMEPIAPPTARHEPTTAEIAEAIMKKEKERQSRDMDRDRD